jgi:uncharacterized Zn finger protein
MSFQLKNFESHLPSDILTKGRDYWNEGNVDNLAQDGDTWTAEVYGTDDYTVEVGLEDGEVTDWSCDCPYDWGDTCKHVVAVLFAIREEASKKPVAKRRGRKPKSGFEQAETIGFTPVWSASNSKKEQPAPDNPLRQIIDKLDAAELRSTMHYLAQRENEVKSYLLTKFSHLITTTSKGQYAALVKSIIDSHSGGRHGFIEYKEASRLGARLYKLLDEAKEPMGSLPLVYLCEEVIRQLANAYQDADDSSGSMGSAMEQAFYLLQKMAKDDKTPADVVQQIFEYALKESTNKDYQGWDWAGNLRSIASDAVRTPADAERLMQMLDQSIKTNSTEKYRDYAVEEAELLKMDLIRKFRSEKEAEAYLYDKIHFKRFREKALEKALKAQRYEEVRRLANEGIAQHETKSPGWVTLWKQWLVRLAEATGDSSAQAASLEELYLDRGEMDYYRQLKKLLPKADFEKKIAQFIQHFRDRERGFWGTAFNRKVAGILVEENRMDDLMAEIRKAPSLHLLDRYSARLSESYKAEYIALYEKCVRHEMEQSSSRDGYQKCAVYVNKILQLGGLEQARQIVLDWRAQYPRRPAMLDELKRFKF